MSEFNHFDADGNAVMVDVSEKKVTARRAVACGRIAMNQECYGKVKAGTVQKGNVLGVAQIAGIMGAKKTSELIPLCHILPLSKCGITFSFHDETREIEARCTVKCTGKTGVEMEALSGVSLALLTIYDMCKAIDKQMCLKEIHLVAKEGGKSGPFTYGENHAG